MLRTHGSEQLQSKGKAELALIDPVDEHLDVDGHALGLQSAGELLVGDVFLLPKALDEGLDAGLVKLARVQSGAYMVFRLDASHPATLGSPSINGIPLMHKTWLLLALDGF
nr:hypothetical protein [Hydrogenophaga sp.]